jgi:hypothetical protein
VSRRLSTFFDYASTAGLSSLSTTLTIDGLRCGVVCLNSAWLSAGENERHHLVISRAQLDSCLECLEPSSLTIALAHHPLSWLEDQDSRIVRDRLDSSVDVLLTGHVHEDDSRLTAGPAGGCASFAARPVHAKDKEEGFNYLEFDTATREGAIHFFRWS